MDLSFDQLSVALGGRRVLDGISARMQPGRITAILGPNGSGKSTLIKALAGLISADVRLGDTRIDTMQPRDRARRIGYLPQDGVAHWDIAVETLVALGRLPYRSPFAGPSAEDRAAVAAALDGSDTAQFAGRRVSELSGGERARVLLARVLAGKPQWLLADEPLASLDPVHQIALLDQLRSLADQGVGVVIVLHDLIQAARAADDVLLLNQGKVVAFGPAREVLVPEPLRQAFGIQILQVDDGEGRLLPVPIARSA